VFHCGFNGLTGAIYRYLFAYDGGLSELKELVVQAPLTQP
jgi:hypothetical protein